MSATSSGLAAGAAAATMVVAAAALTPWLAPPRRPRPGAPTTPQLSSGGSHPSSPSTRHRKLSLGRAMSEVAHGCRRRRPRPVTEAALATWCDELASQVRSGSSLSAAVRGTHVPVPEFQQVVLALDRGEPLGRAVTAARAASTRRDPNPALDVVLAVLAATATHGGPAALALDRVAATLRRRSADAAERRVHSAQARMSAMVLTLLPGAVLGFTSATMPATRAAMVSPAGIACVVAGAVVNAAGWWWMRSIIRARS